MINNKQLLAKFDIITIPESDEAYDTLIHALTLPEYTTAEKNRKKPHIKYFYNYLIKDTDGLQAKLILVEKEYTSLSYLSDYMNYYATCYRGYAKQCRRVHFFGKVFSSSDLVKMILSEDSDYRDLWDSYLGYIVVKPLPEGIIGTTILSTYSDKMNRFFTATREYHINLFGKSLKLLTLPYQEQDGIVGTCASSALWFAFQKTGELFKSKVPNPSDITISAGYDSHHTGKTFPNSSLDITQINKAITAAGLVAELWVYDDKIDTLKDLRAFVYAYLKMGAPVLLGIRLQNKDLHLVTLNGYRFGDNAASAGYGDLLLESDRISKLYAHDDQVGPFSRLEFLKDRKTARRKSSVSTATAQGNWHLNTSWWSDLKKDETLLAAVFCVIVPLPGNIKVSFNNMQEEIENFDLIMRTKFAQKNGAGTSPAGKKQAGGIPEFKWDIYLSENNSYKEEIREYLRNGTEGQYAAEAQGILFESLPQYIWVVKAYLHTPQKDFLVFDLVYDAIDVNYKSSPFTVNIYDESFKNTLIANGMIEDINMFKRYWQHNGHTDGTPEQEDDFEKLNNSDNPETFFNDMRYK